MREAEMEGKIQWVVRGVDKELARQFVDRAGRQRRATGDILNEVLRAYLAGPEDPARPAEASSGSEGAGDFAELVERVERISDRVNSLCTLFEKHQRILPEIQKRLEGQAGEAVRPPAELKAATQQHDAVTQPSRLEASRNRSIPAEHLEEAARLWDGGNGPSFQKIIAAKGWSYHRASLDKAVKRYLKQSSGHAEPASHVDEKPAPPED
jgi:hypothetical protein